MPIHQQRQTKKIHYKKAKAMGFLQHNEKPEEHAHPNVGIPVSSHCDTVFRTQRGSTVTPSAGSW
jgi:hypothetical protein